MNADNDIGQAFRQFLDLGRRMAAVGHFEVAYHSLMAAVHCAEDAEDRARLAEVAAELRRIKGVVDAIRPPHKLSTQAAHTGRSIFEMGTFSSEAAIQRLENQERMNELRTGGEAAGSGLTDRT
jgi:hypothetical protein